MSALPQPPRQRFVYLDALRGLFLFMMAMDHIPSELQVVTNHPWGFVSAAEGFVFLAGFMGGMIYTRKLALSPFRSVVSSTRRRAGTIYAWHLAIYLVVLVGVVVTVRLTGMPPGGTPELMHTRPLVASLAGAGLIYQPGMMDILPLYCLLFLLLPVMLRLLERGHRRVLLLGSFALWAATNVWMPQQPIVGAVVNTGAFNFGAWQLLFVAGTVFGHAHSRGEQLLPAPRASLIALILIAAAVLWANRRGFVVTGWPQELHHWLVNKNNLAPLRMVNVAVLFYLGHLVLQRFPQVLQWKPFALLGQHSIAVFSIHVVVATAINALPWIFAATPEGRFLATLVMLTALFLAAGLHAGWRHLAESRARQPATRRSPSVPLGDIGAA
jgi:hypothetical protein